MTTVIDARGSGRCHRFKGGNTAGTESEQSALLQQEQLPDMPQQTNQRRMQNRNRFSCFGNAGRCRRFANTDDEQNQLSPMRQGKRLGKGRRWDKGNAAGRNNG